MSNHALVINLSRYNVTKGRNGGKRLDLLSLGRVIVCAERMVTAVVGAVQYASNIVL